MPNDLQNLAKLFNNRVFRIPDYQRGYAWGLQQLKDFWNDIDRLQEGRNHYTGQITLEQTPKENWQLWRGDLWLIENAEFEPFYVVDGQQRITTAVILLKCLLDRLPSDETLASQNRNELVAKYLVRSTEIAQSCLFGYESDNPSHEFFRKQILEVPSNDYSGIQTSYTANLAQARDFFRDRLASTSRQDLERLFKALTLRMKFNIYELQEELDVFVVFETMNNRGKPLSRLELLKNRLIYLSTLASEPESDRLALRHNINAVWKTIYEELGRNQLDPLDDDEFLRAHWIIYFGYDKDEADPLTQFLLNRHFTADRVLNNQLSIAEIQRYVTSLQDCARIWQQMHFPEKSDLTNTPQTYIQLERLTRLGRGALNPLVLAAQTCGWSDSEMAIVLTQVERFLLLVRNFCRTRSDVGEAEFYRVANNIYHRRAGWVDAMTALMTRVGQNFNLDNFTAVIVQLFKKEDKQGFYDLSGLRYLLFEYEESLRVAAMATESKITWGSFKGERRSIEHIYPQSPVPTEWLTFSALTPDQNRQLTHSLGNLVAVSMARNTALSNRSFQEKRDGNDDRPGYRNGSFSELEISQNTDWTPTRVLDRGLKVLDFIEKRWAAPLGSRADKLSILHLGFLEPETRQLSEYA